MVYYAVNNWYLGAGWGDVIRAEKIGNPESSFTGAFVT